MTSFAPLDGWQNSNFRGCRMTRLYPFVWLTLGATKPQSVTLRKMPTTLPRALGAYAKLIGKPCEIDAKKTRLWAHEPATLPVHLFHWEKGRLFRQLVVDYEDFLEGVGLLRDGTWAKPHIVPFAVVGHEGQAFRSVRSDFFSLLFFDLKKGTGATCPVYVCQTDEFKLKKLAPSLRETGLCAGKKAKKPAPKSAKRAASKADKKTKRQKLRTLPTAQGADKTVFKEIWRAIPHNDLSAINKSLRKSTNVAVSTDDGTNLLHLACMFNKPEALTLVLQAGIDLDAGDREGTTPLMLAISRDNTKCIRLLLRSGADVTACNKKGHSVLKMAKKGKLKTVIAMIEKAIAKEGS